MDSSTHRRSSRGGSSSNSNKLNVAAGKAKEIPDHSTDEMLPLLEDKPYMHFIVSKSQVGSPYQMTIQAKMIPHLPKANVPVVLNCRNKNWYMLYLGDKDGPGRYFDSAGWRKFATDNKLKLGDGCIFELIECSTKRIRFRVQILDGEFPPELLARVATPGTPGTSDSPIMID